MKLSLKNILLIVISILVGCLFIFSAYAKSIPVDEFTNTIFNRITISWQMASWAARLFIGLEASIGVLMLFNIFGKHKWVLWLALFLLVIFSGYLVGLWYMQGNDVDCGCMGKVMPMSPMASLIKNVVLILLIGALLRYGRRQDNAPVNLASIIVLIIIASIPFIIFPNKLPLHTLHESNNHSPARDDLSKGKHLVAFLSLTCPHCRDAAIKMEAIKAKNPDFPIHVIFMDIPDRPELLKDFMQQTQLNNVPYEFLEEKKFINLAGDYVPSIYLLNGENIEDKIDQRQLNEAFLNEWLSD